MNNEKEILSKAMSILSMRGHSKLTKKQRKERARKAGLASAKARKKLSTDELAKKSTI